MNMSNPLISVIVPVYNVEKYLPMCVDSIIGQTYRNLEIFLVDDGSPDNCGRICDEYAQKDKRIKVIHKKNGGLSDARNVAIDIAKGEYITFVDSDDYLSLDFIEQLYLLAIQTDSEIAISNFFFFKEPKRELEVAYKKMPKMSVYSSKEALCALLYQNNIETSAWGKLYKTSLWKEIRFPKGRLFEDIATIYKSFLLSKRIVTISLPLYYYRIRSDSIMGKEFYPKKMEAVTSSKMMLDDIFLLKDKELCKAATCRYVSMCFNILFQTTQKSKEEQFIYAEIKRYRWNIILDKNARFKSRVALILSFFGSHFLRFIYKFIN